MNIKNIYRKCLQNINFELHLKVYSIEPKISKFVIEMPPLYKINVL